MTLTTLEEVYEELKKEEVTINSIYSFSHPKKTKGKSNNMKIGRIWFNILLPDNFRLIDEAVNKQVLGDIISEIGKKYEPMEASRVVSLINKEAFKMSSINPVSFSATAFILPEHIKKKKEEIVSKELDAVEFNVQILKLVNELIDHMKDNDEGLYKFIMSKASGKARPQDIALLLLAKGAAVDIENITSPVSTNSVTDGFTLKEFYNNAAEARGALFIRSSGAAEPGALARDVVYANSNTMIEGDDCKTKKYLNVVVTASIANTIKNRYYINPKTNALDTIKDPSKLIGKTIQLRSPLYCKQKNNNICKICYGELSKNIDTKYIGVLTSAIINTEGLEGYAMAARHSASRVSKQKTDFNKDMIQLV
jgi:hypothetical protein